MIHLISHFTLLRGLITCKNVVSNAKILMCTLNVCLILFVFNYSYFRTRLLHFGKSILFYIQYSILNKANGLKIYGSRVLG